MDTERWRRIEQVFDQAIELPPEQRGPLLMRECGSDAELRAEVEGLLASDVDDQAVERAVRAGSLAFLAADPLAQAGTVGKYRLEAKIGEGGFGDVYRAWDPDLQRTVAIKTCTSKSRDLRRRFFREAKIAASLVHPNITTVHDLGIQDGVPFLVQELLAGEDLDRWIKRRQPESLEARREILLGIARGLAYAHGQGVLHRDIKPANVRILTDSEDLELASGVAIKIMDFGIARLLHQDSGLTQTGATLGTVGYFAPEQLRGEAVGAEADVFAFGVLAYELLSFERPFRGGSFSTVSYRLLYEAPRPLEDAWSSCPPALAALVARCLEKDAVDRYPGFSEVVLDLEASATGEAVEPPGLPLREERSSEALVPPLGSPPRLKTSEVPRSRRAWGLPVLMLALASALLGVLAMRGLDPSAKTVPVAGAASEPSEAPSTVPSKMPSGLGLGQEPSRPARNPPEEGDEEGNAESNVEAARGSEPAAGRSQGRVAPEEPRVEPPNDAAASALAVHPPVRPNPGPIEGPQLGDTVEPSGATVAAGSPAPSTDDPAVSGEAGMAVETIDAVESLQTAQKLLPPAPQPGAVLSEAAGLPAATDPDILYLTQGPGVVPPHLLSQPVPVYPPRARRRGTEARVVVAVLVDEAGRVARTAVRVRDPRGLGFNRAALAAARQAVFEPARKAGVAGRMWTELSFEFRLQDAEPRLR